MDQPLDPRLRGQPRDAPGALGLHAFEFLPAVLGQNADAVHHRRRTLNGPRRRCVVADIRLDRLHLPDIAVGSHKVRLVRAPHGDAHAPARLRHAPGDVAADKA